MPTPTVEGAILLALSACAARLGVARSYLYSAYVATGRLKTIKLGRRRMVYAPSLDQFVRELASEQGIELPPPAA